MPDFPIRFCVREICTSTFIIRLGSQQRDVDHLRRTLLDNVVKGLSKSISGIIVTFNAPLQTKKAQRLAYYMGVDT